MAGAAAPSFQIISVYSNLDGTVQFIQLQETAAMNGQHRFAGLTLTSTHLDPEFAPTKGRWSKRAAGSERWVNPSAVPEVSFTEWTPDGHIRHSTFREMRTDKPAKSIRREVSR